MRYKGFIFDLDGVLIDSARIHYEGWRNVLRGFNKDFDYGTFRKSYFGKRNHETIEMIFGKGKFSAEEIKNISDEVDLNFIKTVGEVGTPIAGALEFVRSLKEAGEKAALATSAPRRNVDAFLDAFTLHGVFDSEVCADDVSHGKPDPEVFLKAASELNEDAKECVVFEDSLPGVTAAKAAGAACVALLTTTSREVLKAADYFIEDFLDESLASCRMPAEVIERLEHFKKATALKNEVKA
ncbi:MAG: HAD family hydrolase [Candidatus Kryptoniota bacterium]